MAEHDHCSVGEAGCEDEAEEKGEDGRFHDQKLFHGGSGGFNGDGASRGYGNRGNIQPEHDWFIGRPPIGDEIVPAKHPNVITGTIPVIILRIGRTGIDAGGVGF